MPSRPPRAHFVVSNFNDNPSRILSYADSFTLYDQSDDLTTAALLREQYPETRFVDNPGHSLRNFLTWLWENYDDLPETVALLKGNALGRHMSEEYFARVVDNHHYTLLYEDASYSWVPGVSSLLYESAFLERNDSWYADTRPHRYFATLDQLIDFLYVDQTHPEWVLFAPGACYLLPRANVTKNPRDLYLALSHISAYSHFPAEAYMVERLLHMVFSSNAVVNPWLSRWDDAAAQLDRLPDRTADRLPKPSTLSQLGRRLGWVPLKSGGSS